MAPEDVAGPAHRPVERLARAGSAREGWKLGVRARKGKTMRRGAARGWHSDETSRTAMAVRTDPSLTARTAENRREYAPAIREVPRQGVIAAPAPRSVIESPNSSRARRR